MQIKILISPVDINEVREALKGKPDIIDIKNPKEGSLGANFPWIIKEARTLIDEYNRINPDENKIKLSATIGDFPNLPGSASLAALGAAFAGADFIKVGIMGPKSKEDAIKLGNAVVKAVRTNFDDKQVVIAGYADQHRLDTSINPDLIPDIASECGADVAMLDTAIKDGTSIFEHLTYERLSSFIDKCHNYEIKSALAGSLKFDDISSIKTLNPAIIGVRSMVCSNFDRTKGRVQSELVQKLMSEMLII